MKITDTQTTARYISGTTSGGRRVSIKVDIKPELHTTAIFLGHCKADEMADIHQILIEAGILTQ